MLLINITFCHPFDIYVIFKVKSGSNVPTSFPRSTLSHRDHSSTYRYRNHVWPWMAYSTYDIVDETRVTNCPSVQTIDSIVKLIYLIRSDIPLYCMVRSHSMQWLQEIFARTVIFQSNIFLSDSIRFIPMERIKFFLVTRKHYWLVRNLIYLDLID